MEISKARKILNTMNVTRTLCKHKIRKFFLVYYKIHTLIFNKFPSEYNSVLNTTSSIDTDEVHCMP